MAGNNRSYKQIVKSTSIFGGSQVINILIGFVRTKIIAVLLGPVGVGMIGIYQSIVEMIKSFAILGVDSSGIKDIATANGSGNQKIISEVVGIVKKLMIHLSIFGSLLCIVFSYPIAFWAFGEEHIWLHTFGVASLSICLMFTVLSVGQTVVMQGLRKIPQMVKSNILGNFLGLLVSIPLYFAFGLKGIVPSFIFGGIILFATTYFYSRNIDVEPAHISSKYAWKKGKDILKMGMFIVSASICETVSMFILRSFISQRSGVDEVGIFMASWTITSIYLALVLRSMGADFYPRLCGVASSNIRIRRLVNEQTLIVLIVASPIIVTMLVAASYILPILYSSSFVAASELLRWQVLATFLKVISWPMGFILLARGQGKIHFFTNFFFFVVYLSINYFLYPHYGLNGLGVGYLIAYIVYLVSLIIATGRVCNFKWTRSVFRLGIVYLILIVSAFWMMNFEHNLLGGIFIIVVTGTLSIYKFNSIIPLKTLGSRFLKK